MLALGGQQRTIARLLPGLRLPRPVSNCWYPPELRIPRCRPDATACAAIPVTPTRSTAGEPENAEDPCRFEALWRQANRAVALAYGLDATDLTHILASFPMFARKQPAFHAFLLERLADWECYEW
ncbi:hypothetical protein [Metallibacterium sp.]|uniref:hypothetical protein n=1 Tax=Metallibacterium sp. TaxID=2940281 RepID=UPI002604FC16|nr:hypothetical protein [Metallibacterium sp.]